MPDFKRRLLIAESQLFDSLSDSEEIQTFRRSWSTLSQDIEHAASCHILDEDTLAQYRDTSRLVEELCESMMEFYEDVEAIDTAFQKDLDDIFASWEKSAAFPNSQSDTLSTRRDVSLAAKWLSQNYHNPYPASAVRDDISRNSKWNRKDVDAWFTEARKRIGWNEIRKRFFGNKRADAVEKATQFFSGHSVSLDPTLAQSFIDMESRVKDFYTDPFEPSKLAVSLDRAYGCKASRDAHKATRSSRMSSRPFFSDSRPLSPVSRSVSPVRMTRKRRRSLSPNRDDSCTEGPTKRARREITLTSGVVQTQLPSPAASHVDLMESAPQAAVAESPESNPRFRKSPSLSPLPNPKKRRNSTSQAQECPKYPSAGLRLPGLQTVSAPLPSPACSPAESSPDPVSVRPETTDRFFLHPDCTTVSTSSEPQSIVSASALPETQDVIRQLLFPADIPQFSYEFPTATCEQPASTCTTDMTLFNSTSVQGSQIGMLQPGGYESICASPPLGNAVPPVECADLSAFSSFISSSFSADQIFNILPLSFDQESTAVPPVQTHLPPSGTEVEINFSPLLNLGVTTPTPLPQIDDLLFTDFLEVPPPVPSPADVEKARQIAHLEALKRHKDHLQKRIQSLEMQIAHKPVR